MVKTRDPLSSLMLVMATLTEPRENCLRLHNMNRFCRRAPLERKLFAFWSLSLQEKERKGVKATGNVEGQEGHCYSTRGNGGEGGMGREQATRDSASEDPREERAPGACSSPLLKDNIVPDPL